jgi:hypothetical protein
MFSWFKKRKAMDDDTIELFIESISQMLIIQLTVVTNRSLKNKYGSLSREALGYVFGFIDGAMQVHGHGSCEDHLRALILIRVINIVFPNDSKECMRFLDGEPDSDREFVFGAMTGGQQYIEFSKPERNGDVPMGLARFLLKQQA